MKTPPVNLKIGVALWVLSWPITFAVNHHFGLAIFVTSYLAMFYGLWEILPKEKDV